MERKMNLRDLYTPDEQNSFYLYCEMFNNYLIYSKISYYDEYLYFFDENYSSDFQVQYFYNKIPSVNKLLKNNNYKKKEINELSEKELNFYNLIPNEDAKELFLYCLLIEIFGAREFWIYLEKNNIFSNNSYASYDHD